MEKSDKTRNAIGHVYNSEYNRGIVAADCTTGKTIIDIPFYRYFGDEIEVETPIAKVTWKTIHDRHGKFANLKSWAILAIDEGKFPKKEVSAQWLLSIDQYPNTKKSQLTWLKGDARTVKRMLAIHRDKTYGKRFVDKSSHYDENNIYLNETIIVYLKEKDLRYNRHNDYFAKECLKLGLDFDKYSAPNIEGVSSEEIMRKICKDLGYNLLAII